MKRWKLVLGIAVVATSFTAIAAVINLLPMEGTAGNPLASTQSQRSAWAFNQLSQQMTMNPPLTVQVGDTIIVTFGDGWKQSFVMNMDQYGNWVMNVQAEPYADNYAEGGSGGGGSGTACNGTYRPIYAYTEVIVAGESSYSTYVKGYSYEGTC